MKSMVFLFLALLTGSAHATGIEVDSDKFRRLVDAAVECRAHEVQSVVKQLGLNDDGDVNRYGSQVGTQSITPNVSLRSGDCVVRVSSPYRFGGVHIARCVSGGQWFMLAPMEEGAKEFCSFPAITFSSQWRNDGHDQYGNPINSRQVASDLKLAAGSCDGQVRAKLYNEGRGTRFTYNFAREAACLADIDLRR